ncbi:hypothetical protein V8F33_006478 [Rhypophila sp. PSN 637]
MSFADIVGVLLSIFGGIYLILAYGQNRECRTDNCNTLRSYPAGEYRDTAAYLLCAVGGITSFVTVGDFVQCCRGRKRGSS